MKKIALISGLLAGWLTLPALADHRGDLRDAGDALFRSAIKLDRTLHRHGAHRRIAHRSDALVYEAERLRHMLDRPVPPRIMHRQLHRVERSYHELGGALAHAHRIHHDRHVERRFDRVGHALERLRGRLAQGPSEYRYGRGGFDRDDDRPWRYQRGFVTAHQ